MTLLLLFSSFRIAAVYSNNDNKLGPTSLKFHLHKGTNFNRIPSVPPLLTKAEALSPTSIQIHWKVIKLINNMF